MTIISGKPGILFWLSENGTSRMAPRPFKDRITEKAMPQINAIFDEPYV